MSPRRGPDPALMTARELVRYHRATQTRITRGTLDRDRGHARMEELREILRQRSPDCVRAADLLHREHLAVTSGRVHDRRKLAMVHARVNELIQQGDF